MRLAILSDIHGNLHALEAVLADVAQQGVDELIINGDVVNRGPNNVGVMERLARERATLTLGNHDDLLRKWVERDPDIPASWFDDPFWLATAWSAEQVQAAGWLEALRGLPMSHRVALPGAPALLISHGSPRHYREGYSVHLPDNTLAEIIREFPADILIGSHTHRPMERRWGPHTILNSGAVGAPFTGSFDAQYLLLTLRGGAWQWEFRQVPYDRAAALRAYESLGLLAEGGLSARIFYEELRYARPLYAAFWMWAEQRARPFDWESWQAFQAVWPSHFAHP